MPRPQQVPENAPKQPSAARKQKLQEGREKSRLRLGAKLLLLKQRRTEERTAQQDAEKTLSAEMEKAAVAKTEKAKVARG